MLSGDDTPQNHSFVWCRIVYGILYFQQPYTMNSGVKKSEKPFDHLRDHHIIATLSLRLTAGLMASEGANRCCSQIANCL
jgi:hypothetical protein